jgi:two-component system, LytTR family, sensor histidine kinase AlgZ
MATQRRRLFISLLAGLPLAVLLVLLARTAAPVDWGEAVALGVPLAALLVAMAQAAVYPCRALPLDKTPLARIAVVHGVSALVIASIWVVHGALLARLLEESPRFAGLASRAAPLLPLAALTAFLLYLGAVAAQYAALATAAVGTAERAALEGAVAAREAELRALRLQVSPHFLFNSLNAVAGLTVTDPEAARAMCYELADFFRDTMRLAGRRAVSFAEELDLSRRFLAVEQHRFGSRLNVEEELDETALECEVPPLLLQPLLENAVAHGVATISRRSSLHLSVRREHDTLHITLRNERDPETPTRSGTGVGLANVRARLRRHFGNDATLTAVRGAADFTVQLRVPARLVEKRAGSP